MKPFRDLTIRRKLTLGILATSIVPLVIAAVLVFGYQLAGLRARAVSDLAARAELLAVSTRATLEFNDTERATETLATLKARPEMFAVCLYTPDGQVFASFRRADAADFAFPRLSAGDVVNTQFIGGHLELFHPIRNGRDTVGHVYLRTDLDVLYSRLPAQALIVLGVLAGLVLVAFWLSREFQRVISRPILALAETAQAVGERRDYSVRAEKQGQDEIGTLTDGFNQMLSAIQERDHALQTANEALRASNERFQIVARATNDAVWDWNLTTNALWWNEGYQSLFGYTPEETNPGIDSWIKFLHPEDVDRVVHGIHQVIDQGGLAWSDEYRFRRRDGTYAAIYDRGQVIRDATGKPVRMIGAMQDITARKQAEEAIRALNASLERRVQERTAALDAANKELESFSYSVSHDLRAPLRHIQGYVEMLHRTTDGQLAEKPRRYLQVITDASVEMGELIDDLLAFSRMSRAEMSETHVALDELVQDTLRRLEMAVKGRNIVWKIAPLPPVIGDAAMLRQVLANLLGNAVKYSRPRDPAHIEIGLAGEEAGRIIVFVRDNGAGFDMKYAHKLFGVFQRLHRAEDFEGTGIGLATVQRIIARHGGRVWAEGEVDRGATFYFTLKGAIP